MKVPGEHVLSVYLVLHSKLTYFSLYDQITCDSGVEKGLENIFFFLESIGIKNENIFNYDVQEIERFN